MVSISGTQSMSFLVVACILLTITFKYILAKTKACDFFVFASIYFAVGTNIGLICFGYLYKSAN